MPRPEIRHTAAAGPPRVVLFRHVGINHDSRAKKFALTLHRAGYEVILLSVEYRSKSAPRQESIAGVTVLRLPVHQDPAPPYTSPAPPGDWSRRVARARKRVLEIRKQPVESARARVQKSAALAVATARLILIRGIRKAIELATFWTEPARTLRRLTGSEAQLLRESPVVLHLESALVPVLVKLRPDVLHCHHPWTLRAATRARLELLAMDHSAVIHYDAREDFAGIPETTSGANSSSVSTLAREEASYIRGCRSTSTVSPTIADRIAHRYRLREVPQTILNTPISRDFRRSTTLRTLASLPSDAVLLVYSGSIAAVRGIETLLQGLALLPAHVHLMIVPVPYPNPLVAELRDQAAALGCADRLHFAPPVPPDALFEYLSGADIGVHPLSAGSPNHDAALPNKLFEYLHAGLPLVVSSARMMADFVRSYEIGQVFASDDPESFADAVLHELASPTSVAKVTAAAQKYSWEAQEPAVGAHYNALTGFAGTVPEGPFPALDPVPIADSDPGGVFDYVTKRFRDTVPFWFATGYRWTREAGTEAFLQRAWAEFRPGEPIAAELATESDDLAIVGTATPASAALVAALESSGRPISRLTMFRDAAATEISARLDAAFAKWELLKQGPQRLIYSEPVPRCAPLLATFAAEVTELRQRGHRVAALLDQYSYLAPDLLLAEVPDHPWAVRDSETRQIHSKQVATNVRRLEPAAAAARLSTSLTTAGLLDAVTWLPHPVTMPAAAEHRSAGPCVVVHDDWSESSAEREQLEQSLGSMEDVDVQWLAQDPTQRHRQLAAATIFIDPLNLGEYSPEAATALAHGAIVVTGHFSAAAQRVLDERLREQQLRSEFEQAVICVTAAEISETVSALCTAKEFPRLGAAAASVAARLHSPAAVLARIEQSLEELEADQL